jgi:hypothetical protein
MKPRKTHLRLAKLHCRPLSAKRREAIEKAARAHQIRKIAVGMCDAMLDALAQTSAEFPGLFRDGI